MVPPAARRPPGAARCTLLRAATRGRLALLLAGVAAAGAALAEPPAFDATLRERIDAFVEAERRASGIPGIALAIVDAHGVLHQRGYGDDGRGRPIGADTPFPLGSLTKSFTALLVRQAVEAGALDADAPVQRYLRWFRVADAAAARRITLRQLLNQTSGLPRAAGMAPLWQRADADVEALARRLATLELASPPGARYEYSNLNFVLLGAVLEAVSGRSWGELVRARVLQPLAMTHAYVAPAAAHASPRPERTRPRAPPARAAVGPPRGDDQPPRPMSALHRMCFGVPVGQPLALPAGLAPAGGLVASAADMGRYLRMLLAGGSAPGGRIVGADAVAQLLAPAAPPAQARLLSADFGFRYAEGWFAGPFGAAADARWHLGNLLSFAAWMVLLPQSRQALVLLINANTELPFGAVNAVMSRLPLGVVALLHGQPPPQGPSLRAAYARFDAAAAALVTGTAIAAWLALRARRVLGASLLAAAGLALPLGLHALGLGPRLLAAFAPDLALTVAALLLLALLPLPLRGVARLRAARPRRARCGCG